MNLEPENLERACRVSESVPIIPVVCGGGLAPPTSSKAAVGVVINNENLYAQKMECVETYRGLLKPSNNYESATTSCVANVPYESVTTSCVANEPYESATTSCVAIEPVMTMHRRNSHILPSLRNYCPGMEHITWNITAPVIGCRML